MPARFLVQEFYVPLKRAESKRFRMPLIVYVPFIAMYLIYGNRLYDAPVVGAYFPSPTPTITPTMDVISFITFVPTVTLTSDVSNYFLLPTPFTPTPSDYYDVIIEGFPYILNYGEWYRVPQRVKFSYYYPNLGGVNCHNDNWVNGQCKNLTASGYGWREFMGKGIAVHPDMLDLLPFGSLIYVTSPASIRGHYTVIDLCGGCLINGNYYFDFLFNDMPKGLNWSVDVDYLPIRVGWDGTFPPTPTQVIYTVAPTITPTPNYIVVTSTSQPTYTPYPTYTPLVIDTPIPTFTLQPTETVMP